MNERQKRFAEYYAADPNASKAAELAGYSAKTARSIGQRLLTKDDIQNYIHSLSGEGTAGRIADMNDLREFWTSVMNDKNEKTSVRLKASEYLAKSDGAFFYAVRGGEIISSDNPKNEAEKDDVIIYIPKMMSEEECLYHAKDDK